ncbi:MAG: YebC/PmpR family DNA-binding transcriptional regulator [Saprospiraceae bacterium]|nr:YebC/PmpR family DNA-binding transcriptional regulator [Saprospiraceae bacterium]MBK6814687.1 YebC/PmpR family DNA-binding transcriptional regulator [Saprospiraceae bacterium]MBK7437780.1 YebC/PmpR family DNA-binding transcriptional regulator [Saprospiraceae bacterium]MBK8279943.1 YebC/PmpR family DNA-binding transcriptional regulator [Saprospiraceae bacterium]MBK8280993.1 YebC/PmpR family DNA-binding transcriptional regulator [Saprospiraceae bacterium]
MGRIFEVRKSKMFARYDRMAKQFTRIGKEIIIAVKAGGPDPDGNAQLRRCMANAKSVNMPKDRIESAIKRASGKDQASYDEVMFEGYGPGGVAVLVEAATDNNTRTVANVRALFNKYGGSLGTHGSVSFMFNKMGVFKLHPEGIQIEDLEMELIDFGLEEMGEGTGENDEPVIVIRVPFNEFGTMQKALEDKNIIPISSEMEWIPLNTTSLEDDKAEDVLKLVAKMEEDDDVQKVFHNLA